MKYKLPAGIILFFILLIAFACAPKKPAIERNYYILETSRNSPPAQETIPASLKIPDFSVSPGFQGREIIYRSGKSSAIADFYNHYFILPGPMITQLAGSWFMDAGLFSAVIPPSSTKEADYILEGAVTSIYGDTSQSGKNAAVVEINFMLLKNSGFDQEIVFQKKYKSTVKTEVSGAQPLINGLNKGLNNIFTSLERDLATLSELQ
ncbi:MAG: hypothetical protein R6X11_05170 [Desulfonatronovibrio sp.]